MGAQNASQNAPFGRPFSSPRGDLDRPPPVAGMGAQKAPETARGRRPLGAHSRHLQGALIGPRGWWDWAPKRRPKRLTKRAFWEPILVTRGGTLIGPRGWREWAPKTLHETRPSVAHSRHPRGALIGPREWREWAPKRHPKRQGRGTLRAPIPATRGADQGPHAVMRMGARGARFVKRFGRLLGTHSPHPRGPIKAPRG